MDQRFGPYVVGETVGRGNFAKVKLAIHEATGHKVALKIIAKKALEKDPRFEMKIKREINILRLLKHPHIMRLYDVIKTKNDIVLVLEFVGGGELFDHLARRGRLEESTARRLFQQLISGVEYCHRFNVAHRDLKPENIMLTESGSNIKIGDFGLSALMQDGQFFSTSCGTPNYAAPEVVSGRLYGGKESDVWSVGVVLFTMLCGRLPFDEDYVAVLFKKIQRASYIVPPHVSPLARDLLQRLLVVNPLERATLTQIVDHPWVAPEYPPYLLRIILPPSTVNKGGNVAGADPATEVDLEILDHGCAGEKSSKPPQADEGVCGEVAKRLKHSPMKVHSIVSAKLMKQWKSREEGQTPDKTKSVQATKGEDPRDEAHDIFVAYNILADRKLFNRLQRQQKQQQIQRQSTGTDVSSSATGGSAASLGALIAAGGGGGGASATYGSLANFSLNHLAMSPTSSNNPLTVKSPSSDMPPVPSNAAGLPAGVDPTVSCKEYNAKQRVEGPYLHKSTLPTTSRQISRDSSITSTPAPQGASTSVGSGDVPAFPTVTTTSGTHLTVPSTDTRARSGSTASNNSTASSYFYTNERQEYRSGVMFEATNARIVMEHVYNAMQATGLLWKPLQPFAVVAVSHSPRTRLYVSVFRRGGESTGFNTNANVTVVTGSGQYLVDVWCDHTMQSMASYDIMQELHKKLLRLACPTLRRPPPRRRDPANMLPADASRSGSTTPAATSQGGVSSTAPTPLSTPPIAPVAGNLQQPPMPPPLQGDGGSLGRSMGDIPPSEKK